MIGQEFYFRVVLWNIQSILSGGSLSRPIWTYLTSLFRSLGGLVASVEMDLIETGAGSWWNLILPSLLCLLTVRRQKALINCTSASWVILVGVQTRTRCVEIFFCIKTYINPFSKKCSVIVWNWWKKLYKRNDKLDQLFPNRNVAYEEPQRKAAAQKTILRSNAIISDSFWQPLARKMESDTSIIIVMTVSSWNFKVWNSKSNRYLFICLLSWSHVISLGLCACIGQSWKETEAWRANKRAGSEWVVNKRDRWWSIKELSNLDA